MTLENSNRLVDGWVTAGPGRVARTYLDFPEDWTPPGASVSGIAAAKFAGEASCNREHWFRGPLRVLNAAISL